MERLIKLGFALAAALGCAACAAPGGAGAGDGSDELPSALDANYGNIITPKGALAFAMPVAGVALPRGELDGYTFDVLAGGAVRISMSAGDGILAPRVYLYGLADYAGTRYEVTHALGSAGSSASLDATLPAAGQYEVVVGSRVAHAGSYSLALTCTNGACTPAPPAPPPPTTFADTRIAQHDIDIGVYHPDQLFAIGDFIFGHAFTLEEGLGNGLTALPGGSKPRPNERRVQYNLFGGPDADTCATCHDVGGEDGGASLVALVMAEGDGDSESSALLRNGPALLGAGSVQQLAFEMTRDLQALVAAGKSQAAATGKFVTVTLTSKGVGFGSVVVRPDGTVDTSAIAGVDIDFVVRPFGWKGATATLRRFVEGALQTHHGMQAETLTAQNCATPIPARVGNGSDCHDPDADGVTDEITEGQLTALSIYATLQQLPVQQLPSDTTAKARVAAGASLFSSIGCADCHRTSLPLGDPHHAEAPDLTGGSPFVVDLTIDGRAPRLTFDSAHKLSVPLYSDLKRHDMGASLADVHDTRGVSPAGTPVAARMFLTRPLWGVAATPPYLHDGRAPTLRDAILGHDGEAAAARTKFAALAVDDAAKLVEFLQTLTRASTSN